MEPFDVTDDPSAHELLSPNDGTPGVVRAGKRPDAGHVSEPVLASARSRPDTSARSPGRQRPGARTPGRQRPFTPGHPDTSARTQDTSARSRPVTSARAPGRQRPVTRTPGLAQTPAPGRPLSPRPQRPGTPRRANLCSPVGARAGQRPGRPGTPEADLKSQLVTLRARKMFKLVPLVLGKTLDCKTVNNSNYPGNSQNGQICGRYWQNRQKNHRLGIFFS